jgi:excisionase family DNA binding protein
VLPFVTAQKKSAQRWGFTLVFKNLYICRHFCKNGLAEPFWFSSQEEPMKAGSAYLSIGQAAKELGVCVAAVRRWCRAGKLKEAFRTGGNHRRFSLKSISDLKRIKEDERVVVGYARVSSHDQKSDLLTQAARLTDYGCNPVLTDLGSGLNCRKPGLKKLLRLLLEGRVKRLVLTHDDRLLRFGTELIYYLCRWFHSEVLVLDEPQETSFEAELVKDVLTLMTVFSARLYGKRSWKNKSKAA